MAMEPHIVAFLSPIMHGQEWNANGKRREKRKEKEVRES